MNIENTTMDIGQPSTPENQPTKLAWKEVLIRQDWSTWCAIVLIGIPLLIVSIENQDAVDNSFYVYDATISRSYNPDSTIPYWVAGLVPYLMCLLSYAIGELVLWKYYHASLTSAVASLLHFALDTIAAGIVTGLLTEVSKLLVGRYRPDWLSRCNPDIPNPVVIGPFGAPSDDNPVCNSTLSSSKLTDGRKSFPSGHASTAFALSIYGCVYCLWAACFRALRPVYAAVGHSVRRQLLSDTMSFIVLIWMLWQLSFAWGVAISRVIDHKHHPSDIVGGAFLGTLIGVLFSVRALSRAYRVADPPQVPTPQEPLLDASMQRTNSSSDVVTVGQC